MKYRLALGLLIVLVNTPLEAQEIPSVESIISKLAPKQNLVRSFRGITVEDAEPPNPEVHTIDLTVSFEFASATLTEDARVILRNLGVALSDAKLAAYRFEVAGHTDAVGSDQSNMELSYSRANAVKEFLGFYYQVEDTRLKVVGHGERQLLLPGDPNADANRRVQIRNLGRGKEDKG